jgi:hypothetical protein
MEVVHGGDVARHNLDAVKRFAAIDHGHWLLRLVGLRLGGIALLRLYQPACGERQENDRISYRLLCHFIPSR